MSDHRPSPNQAFSDLHKLYLSRCGVELNLNGGFYRRGKSYAVEKKLSVAAAYVDAREKCDDQRPSVNAVARDCGVGWHYVQKVEAELLSLGEVLLPDDIYHCPS